MLFLDSDDYLHELFLEKTLDALKSNPNAIMAYSNGYYVDENEDVIEEMRKGAIKPQTILPNLLLFGRPWGTGACLWRSEKIESLKWIDTRCWEDYVFDVSAALICNEIVYVNEYLVFYDQTDSKEKLSNQNSINTITDKNLSLNRIARLIYTSTFYNQEIIKNKLFHLAMNNTIALLENDVLEKRYYKNNIEIIKGYKGLHISLLFNLLLTIDKKIGLRVLRRLRSIM